MEKMLIAEALDERDFLKKKIEKAIKTCNFVTVKRKKDKNTRDGVDPTVFIEKAKSDYQSITDMISRLKKINTAIILSNATSKITLKSGLSMSRAEAIALRKELTDKNSVDLEFQFIDRMKSMIINTKEMYQMLTRKADDATENYKNNLTSKDRQLTEKEIEAAKTLTADEYPEIIDPIDIESKHNERVDKYNVLCKELDNAIKVSNATSYIEI